MFRIVTVKEPTKIGPIKIELREER
jgi:hypothetical protein